MTKSLCRTNTKSGTSKIVARISRKNSGKTYHDISYLRNTVIKTKVMKMVLFFTSECIVNIYPSYW